MTESPAVEKAWDVVFDILDLEHDGKENALTRMEAEVLWWLREAGVVDKAIRAYELRELEE